MAIKTALRLAGKHPFFWVALLVGVLLLGFYFFAGSMIFRYGTLSKDFGWEYSSKGDNWYVSEVDPNGVAEDKLQGGDRIIAINNDEWITRIGTGLNLHLKLDIIPAETAYTVRVERAGTQHEYDLSVPLKRGFSNFSRIIPLLLVGDRSAGKPRPEIKAAIRIPNKRPVNSVLGNVIAYNVAGRVTSSTLHKQRARNIDGDIASFLGQQEAMRVTVGVKIPASDYALVSDPNRLG